MLTPLAAGCRPARLHRAALRRRPQHAGRRRRAARCSCASLRDALAGGRGAADLLLPRATARRAVPGARARLARAGRRDVSPRPSGRTPRAVDGSGWSVDGAARRSRRDRGQRGRSGAPGAAARRRLGGAGAAALRYEPIVDRLRAQRRRARCPSRCSRCAPTTARPARFVFDHGRLGGDAGLLAFVISGAAAWVERSLHAAGAASCGRPRRGAAPPSRARRSRAVRRGGERVDAAPAAPGLRRRQWHHAAGALRLQQLVEQPYPATLEGAVRSGVAAGRAAAAPMGREWAEGAP